jgi:hypothetical protein
MRHSVVLVSREGMEGWFGSTVLKRSDIEVHHTSDCRTAFQLVLKTDCRLVVAEDWPGCANFQGFLSEILFSFRKEDFRAILITGSMPPGPGAPPIVFVHPSGVDPDTFDRSVVEHLGLKPRAGKRYLVRLFLSASSRDEMSMGLAVCLILNGGGMLVESPKPLPVGKNYYWSFQGIPQLKGIRVPGRVLRPAAPEGGAKGPCFAVAFDEDALQERTLIAMYLSGDV